MLMNIIYSTYLSAYLNIYGYGLIQMGLYSMCSSVTFFLFKFMDIFIRGDLYYHVMNYIVFLLYICSKIQYPTGLWLFLIFLHVTFLTCMLISLASLSGRLIAELRRIHVPQVVQVTFLLGDCQCPFYTLQSLPCIASIFNL